MHWVLTLGTEVVTDGPFNAGIKLTARFGVPGFSSLLLLLVFAKKEKEDEINKFN